jgi:uncharacterized membrane protein
MAWVPTLLRASIRRPVVTAAHVVFLLIYFVAATVLANTAHLGGRLVHEFGLHASFTSGSGAAD